MDHTLGEIALNAGLWNDRNSFVEFFGSKVEHFYWFKIGSIR
jgi:hypothetical protein